MSLRSNPLQSFVEPIYQSRLMLAARRASRARPLLWKTLGRFAPNRYGAFSNQPVPMLLSLAARRASRARGFISENCVASLQN